MSDRYDVIVVGAGPAGVITAITLAKLGKSVILIDRKKKELIGEKTCGDALDLGPVNLLRNELGISPPQGKELSDELISGVMVTDNLEVFRDKPGYTVDRHIYGQRLLAECENAGVKTIAEINVLGPLIEDNYVTGVKYRMDDKIGEFRARLTVDASGTIAIIRRNLPDNFSEGLVSKIPNEFITIAYREIWKLDKKHTFRNQYRLHYDKTMGIFPGYFWIFSKGENQLNVGTGWMKSQKGPMSMKNAFKKAIAKYFTDYEYDIMKKGGGIITMRPTFDCSTFNGGLVVGDAGATTDPLTAEGHGPAIKAGFYAGQVIANALDSIDGLISRENLWEYNMRLQPEIGTNNSVSYATAKFLEAIGESGLDFVFKRDLITVDELDVLFEGKEIKLGILKIIKKIIWSFPRYNILWELKKLADTSEKLSEVYSEYPADPSDLKNWIKKRDTIIKM